MGTVLCTFLGIACETETIEEDDSLPLIDDEEQRRIQEALDMRYSGTYEKQCWKLTGSDPSIAENWRKSNFTSS